MPVIADLHMVAWQSHQAFDVKLILWHLGMLNSFGFKYGNFTALRLAEVKRHPVHEQVVSRLGTQIYHVIALVIDFVMKNTRADFQFGFAIIRWKPHDMFNPARIVIWIPDP